MYKISNTRTGEVLSISNDEPRYITYREDLKCYVQMKEKYFKNPNINYGVAVNSKPYNILGKKMMMPGIDYVKIEELDTPAYIYETTQSLKEKTDKITELEEIICDLDNEISELKRSS